MISVKELKKSFGDHQVLKGIDLKINPGDVVAILGPSGSGKTTLLRCLNFLEKADSGKFVFDDKEYELNSIDKHSIHDIRNKTAFVFQNFNLFPQYNVLKNITLPLMSSYKKEFNHLTFSKKRKMLKLKQEESKQIALDLLDKIGLSDKSKSYPFQLSGGQAQRVAIARALALKPNILCFDEPTSALDPKTTLEIAKLIKGLKKDGYTLLIITHDISFAKEVADKVFFLKKGKVLDSGTVKEILVSPKNEDIVNFLGANEEENQNGDKEL